MAGRLFRVATRGSTLARIQTAAVAGLLGVEVDVVVVQTTGDRVTDTEIRGIGSQGVFVKEVQAAVLEGRADFAVHSAKDLTSSATPGLMIAAVPERADARDALVGATVDGLPPGGHVGTGSVRRRAQLAWLRPDLTFGGLRGNMETRLNRAASFDAVVVAAAALVRLDRLAEASQILDSTEMVPQAGQGALAVECRSDDAEVRALLAAVDHTPSHLAVDAERAFLREISGGCDLPVGAHAVTESDGSLRIIGVVASADGRVVVRHVEHGRDAEDLGRGLARFLLDEAGGAEILFDLDPGRAG